MKWEVSIVPRDSGAGKKTINVNADNWMDALKSGFDHVGKKGQQMKIISCLILEDHTMCVTDLSTKSVFYIKPADSLSLPPIPEASKESFLESISSGSQEAEAVTEEKAAQVSFMQGRQDLPPAPPALPQHKVFYKKDENPGPGSNVIYRERVIKVERGTQKDQLTGLVQHYFESLRREMGQLKGSKYINLAVYDHEFKGNPKGLSLAAMSWQDWKNQEPQIVYPFEEASQASMQQPAAQAAQATPRPQAVQAGPPPPAQPVSAAGSEPQREIQPAQPRKRVQSSELKLEEFDANKVLTEVFEELQDLFLTQTQDDAADFVLDLAMKKIKVDAGTIFLADINTRDMTFAAVRGNMAEKLKGQKLVMSKGIVGFAAREGAAIAIADVHKDPRFCSDFDQGGTFMTKSVLCAPIQYEGRTFGAIELVNRKSGDMFTQGEINVITYLASQLAEFIATALPQEETDFMVVEEAARPKPKAKRPPVARKVKPKSKKPRKK